MMKEIAPVSARKQDSRVWCGPAALQAVLARWGIAKSQAKLAEMLGTTEEEGTRPAMIVKVAHALALRAALSDRLTIADLAHCTRKGIPVICNVQMHGGGHYVVVTDCQDGQVIYFDPDDGQYHRLDNVGFSNLWYDWRDGNQITHCGIGIRLSRHMVNESRHLAVPTALIDLPDIRQRDNYSCGAACACAVGLYFGVGPKSLDEWKTALHTTVQDSTKPQRIIDYFNSLGCTVQARDGMTIDDLRGYWRRGMPVIVCLQEYGVPSKQASYLYGHYVVVIGAALGMIFVQDPSLENVIANDHIKPHGLSDDLLVFAEKFLYETSPAHLRQSTGQFEDWIRQRGIDPGEGSYYSSRGWSRQQLTAALRIQSRQLGHTGADNVPGRMMIDEATWMRVWHDRDADGKPYVQFGIAVGGPKK